MYLGRQPVDEGNPYDHEEEEYGDNEEGEESEPRLLGGAHTCLYRALKSVHDPLHVGPCNESLNVEEVRETARAKQLG